MLSTSSELEDEEEHGNFGPFNSILLLSVIGVLCLLSVGSIGLNCCCCFPFSGEEEEVVEEEEEEDLLSLFCDSLFRKRLDTRGTPILEPDEEDEEEEEELLTLFLSREGRGEITGLCCATADDDFSTSSPELERVCDVAAFPPSSVVTVVVLLLSNSKCVSSPSVRCCGEVVVVISVPDLLCSSSEESDDDDDDEEDPSDFLREEKGRNFILVSCLG